MRTLALRATTNAGMAGNRLRRLAWTPSRAGEQARARQGTPRQPSGFPGLPDTNPAFRRDTKITKKRSLLRVAHHFTASPLHYFRAGREAAVFVSPQSGGSCPSSDGTRRVAGEGRRREAKPHGRRHPAANRRSRSVARTAFVVTREARGRPRFKPFAIIVRLLQNSSKPTRDGGPGPPVAPVGAAPVGISRVL